MYRAVYGMILAFATPATAYRSLAVEDELLEK
jgi:hypothetical protein